MRWETATEREPAIAREVIVGAAQTPQRIGNGLSLTKH
jgi:hypothetical protein